MKSHDRRNCDRLCKALFVVGPHPQHFDRFFLEQYLVNEAMLNIDAPRVGAFQVAHEFFVARRRAEGIFTQECDEFLGRGAKVGLRDSLRVFLC